METEQIEDPLVFESNQTNTVDDDDPVEDNKDDKQDKEALEGTKMNTKKQMTEKLQENLLINLTKMAATKRMEICKYFSVCVIAMLLLSNLPYFSISVVFLSEMAKLARHGEVWRSQRWFDQNASLPVKKW